MKQKCHNWGGTWPHPDWSMELSCVQLQLQNMHKWNLFSSVCCSQPARGQSQPTPWQAPQLQHSVKYNQRVNRKVTMTHMVRLNLCTKATNKNNTLQHFNITIGATFQVLNFIADSGFTVNILSKADLDHHISLWQQPNHTSTGNIPNHSLCERYYMLGHNMRGDLFRKQHYRLGNIKENQTPVS